MKLNLDPTTCTGHGLCEEMLPEAIELDEWGYPILAGPSPTEAAVEIGAGGVAGVAV